MAARTLRIDLEVKVRDLTKREIKDAWGGEEPPADEYEGSELGATDAFELAEVVSNLFHEDAIQEAFAGSNIFLTFEGEPLVIAAEWVPEQVSA